MHANINNFDISVLLISNYNISSKIFFLILRHTEYHCTCRLGGGPEDAVEIKEHVFFENINFKDIYEKKVKWYVVNYHLCML